MISMTISEVFHNVPNKRYKFNKKEKEYMQVFVSKSNQIALSVQSIQVEVSLEIQSVL